jgi:hypothetical protein
MNKTIITTGLCGLLFVACSAEPATPSTPPAGTPAGANPAGSAQAALVLDKVP